MTSSMSKVTIIIFLLIVALVAIQAYFWVPSCNDNILLCLLAGDDKITDYNTLPNESISDARQATINLQMREIEQQSKLINSLTQSITSKKEEVLSLLEQLNKTKADYQTEKDKILSLSEQLNEAKVSYETEKKNRDKLIQSLSERIESLNKTRESVGSVEGQPMRLERFSDRPEVREAIQRQIANESEMGDAFKERVLPAEHPNYWRQRTFKAHGVYGYLQYSGYRSGDRTFAAPGLHAKSYRKKRRFQGCTWYGNQGQVQTGRLGMLYENEAFNEQYEVVVLKCVFKKATSESGGYVVAKLDFEEFVMYVDENDKEKGLIPLGPFKDEIAFCSACFHDTLYPRHVKEWMEYHRVLHVIDHFYFYDGGALNGQILDVLEPYKQAGMLTLTDIKEFLLFNVFYWSQSLALLDCFYRNRYTTKWLMTGDVDEYLHVKPPATLYSILAKHGNQAWISHQGLEWNEYFCDKEISHATFTVERMVLKSTNFTCHIPEWDQRLCYAGFGHRKYFLNPREVEIAGVHDVRGDAFGKGINLRAGVDMWHYHFRGLGSAYAAKTLCNSSLSARSEDEDGEYVYDDEMARAVALVKQCPLEKGKGCALEMAKKLPTLFPS